MQCVRSCQENTLTRPSITAATPRIRRVHASQLLLYRQLRCCYCRSWRSFESSVQTAALSRSIALLLWINESAELLSFLPACLRAYLQVGIADLNLCVDSNDRDQQQGDGNLHFTLLVCVGWERR